MRGVTVQGMALIIALFAWASPARQIRAQVLSLKERAFVDMAMLSGMSEMEIIFSELVPHMFQWMSLSYAAVFRGMWWWWGSTVFTLTSIFISLYLLHLGFDEVINPRMRSKI
jgi:peptide/nickel transport system permease protein